MNKVPLFRCCIKGYQDSNLNIISNYIFIKYYQTRKVYIKSLITYYDSLLNKSSDNPQLFFYLKLSIEVVYDKPRIVYLITFDLTRWWSISHSLYRIGTNAWLICDFCSDGHRMRITFCRVFSNFHFASTFLSTHYSSHDEYTLPSVVVLLYYHI